MLVGIVHRREGIPYKSQLSEEKVREREQWS